MSNTDRIVQEVIHSQGIEIISIIALAREQWMTEREAEIHTIETLKREFGVAEAQAQEIWNIYQEKH